MCSFLAYIRLNLSNSGGDAARPLPKDGAQRYSAETQQSGHTPRSVPEVKKWKK